jgi:hypothetical protein
MAESLKVVIEVNKGGITARPYDGKNTHDHLIYFPHHGASPGYPEVASLDEAITMMEKQGYEYIIVDYTFGSGIYIDQWHHGAGGIGRGYNLKKIMPIEDMGKHDDPYLVVFKLKNLITPLKRD